MTVLKKILGLAILMAISFQSFGQNIYKYHPLFIYNFSKYIEWPQSFTGDEFKIALVGKRDAYNALNDFVKRKKNINGKAIKVNRYNKLSDVPKTNIVFITKNINVSPDDLQSNFNGSSTLIITEHNGLTQQGASHINFRITNENKIRFDLNASSARKDGLKISNSLTSLASNIY